MNYEEFAAYHGARAIEWVRAAVPAAAAIAAAQAAHNARLGLRNAKRRAARVEAAKQRKFDATRNRVRMFPDGSVGLGQSVRSAVAAEAENESRPSPAMTPYTATMIAEGVDEADEETQIAAWQYLIDSGLAWQLQGSFGRQAARMIEEGVCHA